MKKFLFVLALLLTVSLVTFSQTKSAYGTWGGTASDTVSLNVTDSTYYSSSILVEVPRPFWYVVTCVGDSISGYPHYTATPQYSLNGTDWWNGTDVTVSTGVDSVFVSQNSVPGTFSYFRWKVTAADSTQVVKLSGQYYMFAY